MNFVRWARDLNDQAAKAEFYPEVDKRTLFRDGYIASHSGHSRGSTMDLTLARADGAELDMGTHFDFFSPKSWTADPSIGAAQHANRMLLAARDASARLSRLRQGMVAFYAARRAVSRRRISIFRCGNVLPTRAGESQPQIKFLDQIVVVELIHRAALECDLAVDDDVAAVGDADRLGEILLRHQDGQANSAASFR